MRTERANLHDAQEITALHFSSGVDGILSKFEPIILEKFFYLPLLVDKKYTNWKVVANDGHICGFISINDLRIKDRKLEFYLKRLVLVELLKKLAQQPIIVTYIINYLRSYFYSRRYLHLHKEVKYEIQILIVEGKNQSLGVGSHLLGKFGLARDNGLSTVVQTQSKDALRFYEKFQFYQLKHFTVGSRHLWICRRDG